MRKKRRRKEEGGKKRRKVGDAASRRRTHDFPARARVRGGRACAQSALGRGVRATRAK